MGILSYFILSDLGAARERRVVVDRSFLQEGLTEETGRQGLAPL